MRFVKAAIAEFAGKGGKDKVIVAKTCLFQKIKQETHRFFGQLSCSFARLKKKMT
ncbi:MAG: hypothetical protein WCL50_12910 [Spirochaetota bacterium]